VKVLVFGYGNPGRLDDGLGPAFVEAVAALGIDGVTADSNYQLQPEDALFVAEHDAVILVDAAVDGPEPYAFTAIKPRAETSFTTHHMSPEGLMALACDTFGTRTEGYLLAIRGHEFDEFGERLSARAQENLAAALAFLRPRLEGRSFRNAPTTIEG
jgi:hydrogenase maturation protease